MTLLPEILKIKLHRGWLCIPIFCILMNTVYAQNVPSGTIMQGANNVADMINKMADKASAVYTPYIDNPYVPKKINKELTTETARLKLIDALKKTPNWYSLTKINAYQNLGTNLIIRNIKNPNVTDSYIVFTSGKENHSKDTVYINYKDIVNRQLSYFVKVYNDPLGNPSMMPYVKIGDHLITCGGKEFGDLVFYMQHQYAVKYYQADLENFKTIAANYQKLDEKPKMSEEQRKLFVQGNAISSQLNYDMAIVYYDKAIALNPVSSPQSYYNYALIAALAEKYELAILNMQKYLLLLPNAEDAQTAQDKIYEWQTLLN